MTSPIHNQSDLIDCSVELVAAREEIVRLRDALQSSTNIAADNLRLCDAVRALQAQIDELRKQVPVWVKCSDRLPESDCDVAFIADIWERSIHYSGMHGMVLGGRYRASDLGGRFSVPGHAMNASHWMPLPLPPSGTEINEENQNG